MLDARAVAAVDPGGMREIIASLPDQLSAGMKVGESTRVPIEEAQRIFIVGMGGSAIGGDVFASWIADRAKVPIQVVRDYRIPAYGRPEDLLIAVSYSGNTEETLAATTLALRTRSTVPVTYGAGPFVAIARRWQTQLNENAKVLAFSSTFPEADHNELVGWVEDARARTHRAILLRDRDEAPDLRRQLDITVSLMSRKAKVEQVHDEGPTLVSRMLGTLFLGDYVSLYLAALRRVDPLVLKPIQTLKAKLAESHRKG